MRSSLALLAVTVAVTYAGRPDVTAVDHATAVGDVSIVSDMGETDCTDQEYCEWGTHRTVGGGTSFAPGLHTCQAPTWHAGPACVIGYNADDVLDAPVSRLAAMLRQPGTNVEWNAERSAVQLIGCDGHIVLHLPVAEATGSYLNATLPTP